MAACPVRIPYPAEPPHPVVSPEPVFSPEPPPPLKPSHATVIPKFPKPQTADVQPEPEPFVWTHDKVFALAWMKCVKCRGVGLTIRKTRMQPCGCVTRRAFNTCLGKYHRIQATQDRLRGTTPVLNPGGRDLRFTWSRKSEEFCADFFLLSKRALNSVEWGIFELFMLQGHNWRYCTAKLKMQRGPFFHAVYKIREILGRAFMETRPYPLFPLDQYFGVRECTQPDSVYRNNGKGHGDNWREAEKRTWKNMTDAAYQPHSFKFPYRRRAA